MVDIKLESSKVQQPQGVNKSTDQQTMMMKVLMTLGCLLLAAAAVCALSMSNTNGDRRSFLQTQTSAAGAAAASLLVVAPESGLAEEGTYEDFVTAESGLRYKVLKEGEGAVPSPGQTVKAHYTGWLDGFDDAGKKFDSSRDRGRPADSFAPSLYGPSCPIGPPDRTQGTISAWMLRLWCCWSRRWGLPSGGREGFPRPQPQFRQPDSRSRSARGF